MSRVIRAQRIDDGFFPLLIEEVPKEVPQEEEFIPNGTADLTEDFHQKEQEVDTFEQQKQAWYQEQLSKIEEIRAAAQQELLASQEQAREIVAEAEKQAEQQAKDILLRATEKGYSEGQEKGLEEGRARGFAEATRETEHLRSEARDQTRNMLEQAEDIRIQLIRGAEEEVVELAMTIASKVIRSHVEVKRDTVVHLASEALDRAVAAGYYTIFVHPGDVELLKEYISELRRSAPGNARIHIIPDGSIGQGGCKVETEQGMVDVTLESQLEQIRKALREVLEGRDKMAVENGQP